MAVNTEPAWYQQMVKAQANDEYVYDPDGPYTFRNDNQPNAITLRSGSEDMIRCSTEGFWVRGVKVEQDDNEAKIVYNAFKEWLTWAQLNKDYQ